jgi:acyl carrier protein
VGWGEEAGSYEVVCWKAREGEGGKGAGMVRLKGKVEAGEGREAEEGAWSKYGNEVLGQRKEQYVGQVLRKYLRERVPEYMVPGVIVCLEALPLTPNGKLNRRGLPRPEMGREGEGMYVAPRTELEKKIAEIWSEVLGIQRIGLNDNFFDIGGHSLFATQVISRLRNAFAANLPLRLIFERPTISRLAEALDGPQLPTAAGPPPPVVAQPDHGAIDPDALSDHEVDALLRDLLSKGGVYS